MTKAGPPSEEEEERGKEKKNTLYFTVVGKRKEREEREEQLKVKVQPNSLSHPILICLVFPTSNCSVSGLPRVKATPTNLCWREEGTTSRLTETRRERERRQKLIVENEKGMAGGRGRGESVLV